MDDRIIESHGHHQNLSARDIQIFAQIMHKYIVSSKGEKMQVRQLLNTDVNTRTKVNTFSLKCITSNVPWLLRDSFLIDANALLKIQGTATAMKRFNKALSMDAKPAHNDPTTWSNDHYWEYFTELFPDSAGGGTANTAHAHTVALQQGRDFCHVMEHAVVTKVEECSTFVFDALRNKLAASFPDALWQGLQEANTIVDAIKQEFQRMALEPARYKHAAEYVKSWLDSQAPQHLIEIEK